MEHWRRVLPEGVMLDVQYEELVADFAPQARRIVAHCGLEWDDACLAYDKRCGPSKRRARPRCASRSTAARLAAGGPKGTCSSPYSTGSGPIWPGLALADRLDPRAPAVSRVGQLDDEPVVSGLDAAWQFGSELAIIQALIHVSQDCAPRTQASDPRQRLCEMGVGRVRVAAQAIDDPQLDTLKRGERVVVEFGDIGRVGKSPDPET